MSSGESCGKAHAGHRRHITARVRRAREEQENAQERRKQEAAFRKAQQEEERVKGKFILLSRFPTYN